MTTPVSRRQLLRVLGLGAVTTPATVTAARGQSTPNQVAKRPRGIVFLVSDGMSPGVFTMAQAFSQFTRRQDTAWWSWYQRPDSIRGLMDTASANSLVTDSAAASSAWGGGKRVHNGSINVSPDGSQNTPIAAVLKQSNPRTRIGLVTTATVTHATPAGFAANSANRKAEDEIAPQYLNRVDVILGGGSDFFRPAKRPGAHNLRGEFALGGYATPDSRDELLASKSEKLLGTFTRGHLPFSIDRDHDARLQRQIPSLNEMAMAALSRFLESGEKFLLQIEGARIDHAAHLNDIGGLLHDQLAFDDTLASVLQVAARHPDILVIATSDHGNSNPGLNGMGNSYRDSTACFRNIMRFRASHERMFSQWKDQPQKSPDSLAQLVSNFLGLQLTPQEAEALVTAIDRGKVTEWNHLHHNPEGLLGQITGNHSGIGWTGTTHTSDPTIITATGPGADRFQGIVKNSDVFSHLTELLT